MSYDEFIELSKYIKEKFQWKSKRMNIKYVNFDFDCRDYTVWKVIFRTNVGEQIIFQKKYGEDLAKTIYKYLEGLS